jgi:DNA-binding SARP family transcriptional activator
MKEKRIIIRLFGKFEILIDGELVLENINQSKKTRDFLAYLILHKDKAVTHTELFENLWLDDENANPENALRTLLYRYRKTLEEKGIDELKDSVISNTGSYQWNPDVPCQIDVFEFETLYEKVKNMDINDADRIKLATDAMNLYTADLLTVADETSWVIPNSVYYHDLYLSNIFLLIDSLKEKKNYQEIIRVCKTALDIDLFEDRLHLELIQALMHVGQNRAALSQFQATSDLYYQHLGVAPSDNIRALYKNIIQIGQDMEMDIKKIQETIDREDDKQGAFVCEYEIFKNIYHLQNRLLERSGGAFFISLLTLNNMYDKEIDPLVVDHVMKKLLSITQRNLRKGDTIARYSSMQYVIMLPLVNYETGKIVMERIKKAFYGEYVKLPVMLTYKLRPLGQNRKDMKDLMSPDK